MRPFRRFHCNPCINSGFTLIEVLAATSVLIILTTIGMSMFAKSSIQVRRTGSETMIAMIDLARNTAMARRRHVLLAFADPEEVSGQGNQARLGIFLCDEWPESGTELKCRALQRWRNLNVGVVLLPGSPQEYFNPLDAPKLTLHYGRGNTQTAAVHAMVFNARGGLHYPLGELPGLLRLAEGSYHNGKPVPAKESNYAEAPENRLKIGRVIARPMEIAP